MLKKYGLGIGKFVKILVLMIIVGALLIFAFFKIWESKHIAKIAIREEDFQRFESFIIVRETYHTGTGWEIIGDSNGYYEPVHYQDVIITSQLPEGISKSFECFFLHRCL